MIEEKVIRQWFDLFHKEGPQLTEVRVLAGKKTYSGYFSDPETLITAIRPYESNAIYATMNEVNEACYGRTQRDVIVMAPKSTTTDNDIQSRRWLLIDLDPKRPSDTNSSDAEKSVAEQRMRAIVKFLRNEGFNFPIVADSANGYHLYYRVDLPNDADTTELVKTFLYALSALFSDDKVDVDVSVYNASRIVKIIGTSSNKGTGTKDRPQRISKFVYIPEDIRVTERPFIQKVAGYYPKPETPTRFNGYSTDRFDLDSFLEAHGIEVVSRTRFSGGEKLILKECPFDPNHKDAAILVLDNGAISFKCFHNSCAHYGWRDFRVHFDPDAYSRRDREEYRAKREYYGVRNAKPVEPVTEDARGKFWLQMSEIKRTDPSKLVLIPSGLIDLDRKIGGFALGEVTVLSGLSGAGKTTLLNLFILSAVQAGYFVAAWSGEMQESRFQSWIDQMAAGKDLVRESSRFDGFYYAPADVCEKIHQWMDGKFWLYNNEYGAEWSLLKENILTVVREKGVRLVLVDNLMALDFDGQASDNDLQTRFIKDLKDMAKKENIHIILVCHPRKEQSFQLLRKESIAGTANLTNLCDNLLISHRVGRDFEKRAKDFWGAEQVTQLLNYDAVLEIAKNRSNGVVDHIIGLYYEAETRRVKNDPAENIFYGWREKPTQVPLPLHTDEDFPDDIWYQQ